MACAAFNPQHEKMLGLMRLRQSLWPMEQAMNNPLLSQCMRCISRACRSQAGQTHWGQASLLMPCWPCMPLKPLTS